MKESRGNLALMRTSPATPLVRSWIQDAASRTFKIASTIARSMLWRLLAIILGFFFAGRWYLARIKSQV